jgi:hypothetical protein
MSPPNIKVDPEHAASLTVEALVEPLLIDPAGRLILDGNHRAYQAVVGSHAGSSAPPAFSIFQI